MKAWGLLMVAVVAEVIATSALKQCEGFTKLWPSLIVALGYCVALTFLSLAVKTIPVGMAYAAWSGLGVALVTLVGWVVLDQRLDAPAILGMILIVSGVAVMNLFSKSIEH